MPIPCHAAIFTQQSVLPFYAMPCHAAIFTRHAVLPLYAMPCPPWQ